ncbi:hypothetical protein NM688_g876 [Phlebia brevispora]|uniref:Uncharacterized protein n=1 Tax=Phlebia brevispora TaxID=194682 RepID=A0ACC1TDU9_9APHY|nr:hypothetical protein NM688_g876 [Phlebia brevispora]
MDVVPPTPPPLPSLRSRKQSSHRVPVPSLTPSLLADVEGNPGISESDSRSDTEVTISSPLASGASVKPKQLSVRRNAPGLSIVTNHPPESYIRAVESGLTPTTAATDVTFNSAMSSSPDPRAIGFVGLSLRPVSAMFSTDIAGQIDSAGTDGRPPLDIDSGTPTTTTAAISPRSPDLSLRSEPCPRTGKGDSPIILPQDDQTSVIQALQEQILTARRAWQRQVWELEGQVRDLKAEVEDLRAKEGAQEYCPACGRGPIVRSVEEGANIEDLRKAGVKVGGVVNRPRARTGVGSRFASGV